MNFNLLVVLAYFIIGLGFFKEEVKDSNHKFLFVSAFIGYLLLSFETYKHTKSISNGHLLLAILYIINFNSKIIHINHYLNIALAISHLLLISPNHSLSKFAFGLTSFLYFIEAINIYNESDIKSHIKTILVIASVILSIHYYDEFMENHTHSKKH